VKIVINVEVDCDFKSKNSAAKNPKTDFLK